MSVSFCRAITPSIPGVSAVSNARWACPWGSRRSGAGSRPPTLPGTEVPVYFLDHQALFGRDGIYGDQDRTRVYRQPPAIHPAVSRGALQLAKMLDWKPDVVHAHDWPAALAPVYLNTLERDGFFVDTGSVLTIHNLAHQGIFPKEELEHTLLGWEQFHGAGFEYHDRVNLLQAGLRNADVLTTVSPTYAEEIQTPEYGHRLDGLLRHRSPDLYGVLNGMDDELWDPEKDTTSRPSSPPPNLGGKAVCKAALQEVMGLEVNAEVPLYGMVSRLVEQKGFGELCGPTHGSLYNICDELDLQFVILGTGEAWCEEELAKLGDRLPNLAVDLEFNEPLAHLIMAGIGLLSGSERLRTVRTDPDVRHALRHPSHRAPDRRIGRYGGELRRTDGGGDGLCLRSADAVVDLQHRGMGAVGLVQPAPAHRGDAAARHGRAIQLGGVGGAICGALSGGRRPPGRNHAEDVVRPWRKNNSPGWSCLVVVVAGALWMRNYFSPAQAVKRQFFEAVASFENGKILGVMPKISRSYSDDWGGSYESLGGRSSR